MIIKTRNLLHESAPKTYLNALIPAGENSFGVKNTTGFTNSWAVQIGETGEENTEIRTATIVDIDSLTISGTMQFDHPADTPVYAIKYDQVVFERSTVGTAGTATPMTNGTISIQPDQPFTQFDDTSGSVSYAYKTYFRSSGLAANSSESDWITSTGFSFYSLARIRERTKTKLWNAEFLNDEMIDDWTNEWKETLRREAIEVNEDYSLGTVNVAFGTSGLGTITASDFRGNVQRMWIHTPSGTSEAHKMDMNDFVPGEQFSSSRPKFAMQGDSVFLIKPEGNGGTAQIVYPSLEAPLDSDTEEIPVYMRDHTKSFVDYNVIQAQYKDEKITLTEKVSLENALKAGFKNSITPRNRTGQTYVEVVENLSGEDGWLP